jgi:hypothetical protein
MKKIFFVAMVIVYAITTSFAQSKVPIAVRTAFKQKFPDSSKIKWNKEKTNEYEASFEIEDVGYSANFTYKGEWLETESPFSFNELPEKVKETYNNSQNGKTPKAVSKIETSEQIVIYEVENQKKNTFMCSLNYK